MGSTSMSLLNIGSTPKIWSTPKIGTPYADRLSNNNNNKNNK